ncbi:MAG TPA: DsbA family protein, partial [Microthrixaceae bacterium]|nr:DsbA family protein [Microthrixaceae bacterium]
AYFTEGRNVAERVTLIEICRQAGLDPEAAAEVLESGGFAEEVRTDEETARDLDITGVPATVVDGRLLVPGAQEVATFARVLERAAASVR